MAFFVGCSQPQRSWRQGNFGSCATRRLPINSPTVRSVLCTDSPNRRCQLFDRSG